MPARLTLVIVVIVLTASALLGLRHHRLELARQIAVLRAQMDEDRRVIWDAQSRLAAGVSPQTLREAAARRRLELEPVVPAEATSDDRIGPVVQADAAYP